MPIDLVHKTLIVVAGPTAVGKTAVSIMLAREFGAEIISADSRQLFRELTIGTAKPSAEELAAVRHHFINYLSINEQYNAAQYGEEATRLIYSLFEQKDFLIMCGGSGLYIKAALEGFDDIPAIDPKTREGIRRDYESNGLGWLQEQLKQYDPEYFQIVDKQNPQRMMRALEVVLDTGSSIQIFFKKSRHQHPFRVLKVGLELPREDLYARIDGRMDDMIASGLFEEARQLYEHRHHNALQTVGYQEVFGYLDGFYDREEAIRLLKRNSRHYAKRQLTWFRRDPEIRWFNPTEIDNIVDWIKSQTTEPGQL